MSGIRVGTKLFPSVWATLGEQDGGPLFVAVDDSEESAAIGLVPLDLLQEWGAAVAAGDMEESPYSDLYVLLPGFFLLAPCELGVETDAKGTWLAVRVPGSQFAMHRSRLH